MIPGTAASVRDAAPRRGRAARPGEQRFGEHPRLEQLGVGGAGEVVEERRNPAEVGGIDRADHRAAAGTAADRDQALHLEQAQALRAGFRG